MPMLRMRLTASEDDVNAIINVIASLEGVHLAEEVADLMPHMDADDSSSAGLTDDTGPGSHALKVETANETVSRRVTEAAEAEAHDLGIGLEFVERF